MNRIDQTFKSLRRDQRKALIGYITAGYPAKASLQPMVSQLEQAGLDMLEIGVPFSDPIADGPTIQHSSQMALRNGVTLAWILQSVSECRRRGVKLPILLMSYCNPIYAMGIELFFKKSNQAGVDGLIVPDMIPEEGRAYGKAAAKHGIDLVYLVTPTTPRPRIRMICQKSNGFVYAVSLTGVTGVKKALPSAVASFLKSIKAVTSKPVAVGFGITSSTQAQMISRHVDGVIVGSELIRQISKSSKKAVNFIRSLRKALDNPSRRS